MMVGTVVFEFSHEGRSLDLEFGVLKGGDTGREAVESSKPGPSFMKPAITGEELIVECKVG